MVESIQEVFKEQTIDYILSSYPDFKSLINSSREELEQIPDLSKAKAKQFFAYLQISKLLLSSGENAQRITGPKDIYENLKNISLFEEERFIVVLLNTKNIVLSHYEVSKGTINATIVHPREVFSQAVRMKANAIICCHNHPSGDPTPSSEDIQITQRLVEVGNLLGIKVLDHVIIGNGQYLSLKEKGLI
ncbi:DNA repair protein RadC [Tissierella creatinini]|nr:DNA repair protein RadC [Tissierella creatinini]TJX62897.1 DNA repair protein RadC [Soehngenia saccharolytica]